MNVDVAPGILREGSIEAWNSNIINQILQKGDCYINIGANFGYFSILAGSIVGEEGKVISFEANPLIYECLSYSVFYSGYPNRIDAYNYALSDLSMEQKFKFNPVFSGRGSLVTLPIDDEIKDQIEYQKDPSECRIGKVNNAYKELVNGAWDKHAYISQTLHTKTLDQIISTNYPDLPKIDMIHMDVEGAESLVLRGSMTSIERYRPILLVEFDPATLLGKIKEISSETVYDTFNGLYSLRYNLYRVIPNQQSELSPILNTEQLVELPHCDILIIPKEKLNILDQFNLIF